MEKEKRMLDRDEEGEEPSFFSDIYILYIDFICMFVCLFVPNVDIKNQ